MASKIYNSEVLGFLLLALAINNEESVESFLILFLMKLLKIHSLQLSYTSFISFFFFFFFSNLDTSAPTRQKIKKVKSSCRNKTSIAISIKPGLFCILINNNSFFFILFQNHYMLVVLHAFFFPLNYFTDSSPCCSIYPFFFFFSNSITEIYQKSPEAFIINILTRRSRIH
jgi:hypothetical protein